MKRIKIDVSDGTKSKYPDVDEFVNRNVYGRADFFYCITDYIFKVCDIDSKTVTMKELVNAIEKGFIRPVGVLANNSMYRQQDNADIAVQQDESDSIEIDSGTEDDPFAGMNKSIADDSVLKFLNLGIDEE